MGKLRVNQLSKELGMTNTELVQKLQEFGYPVKMHSSTLEDYQVQDIRDRILGKKAETVTSTGRPTVKLRKKPRSADSAADEDAGAAQELAQDATFEVTPEKLPEFAIHEDHEPVIIADDAWPAASWPQEPISVVETAVSEEREKPVVSRRRDDLEFTARIISVAPPTLPAGPEPPVVQTAEAVISEEPRPEAPVQETPEPAGVTALETKPATDQAIQSEPETGQTTAPVEPARPEEPTPRITRPETAGTEPIKTETVRPEPGRVEAPPATPKEKAGPQPSKTIPEPKIKRIEKTTSEPARIISRPQPPAPARPQPPAPARPQPPAPARPQTPDHPPQGGPQAPQAPRTPASPFRPTTPRPGSTDSRTPGGARPPARPAGGPPQRREPDVVAPPVENRKSRKKKKTREQADIEAEILRQKASKRREVIERVDLYDSGDLERPSRGSRRGTRQVKRLKKTEITTPKASKRRIKVVDVITVAELAKKMGVKGADVVRRLMAMGQLTSLTQPIDFETATLIAQDFGYEVEKGSFDEEELLQLPEGEKIDSTGRPPVVTVMGHVDHGKTSLLDAIRQTKVTEGEAGGITQHIGAYHVPLGSRKITFLDTPGHAAFTSMRARGAKVTDIVVLVVAADDGVMQQTREAADHAKAAGVPIIVAVNKVDKPEADPDRVRREMVEIGLVPEAWGGDTIFVDVSAKKRIGVDELMEMILLQAELLELKAPTEGRARGWIIEARLDKGRGPVATVLVQSGRLRQGDPYVCGVYYGRIRAMFDDTGQRVDEAGPSVPVEIQGITGVPLAGDEFVVVEDEKQAKQISQHRLLKQRETDLLKTSKVTLENLFDSIKEGAIKELNLVLKADVQGSLEAISDALRQLATQEIKVNLVHSSIGTITETDIMLASASNALVVGFNVRPHPKVQELAEAEHIQIRFYDIIYRLIDEIKESMAGLLEPIKKEKILGRAEVREAFHITKVGTIAGSAVTDGKVTRGARARLLRDSVVVYDGRVSSLRRLKDDVKEVLTGFECGIGLDNFNDVKAGDIIEAYIIEEVAATLD